VAPVHERVAPLGVLGIFLGSLPEVTLDVAVDPLRVFDVVVCVFGLLLALYLEDTATRLVALGLTSAVSLTNRPRLLGLEPLLQLLGPYVHNLVEPLDDLLPVVRHVLTS
jgi:hypothetical protein